ncbi:MAG: hypothetical protein K0S08_63 [Gammaproteobacteria bacterium]|jgi:hypothetical protein|nr:hypothetical protein [Gammaproteobacteria bacterium]
MLTSPIFHEPSVQDSHRIYQKHLPEGIFAWAKEHGILDEELHSEHNKQESPPENISVYLKARENGTSGKPESVVLVVFLDSEQYYYWFNNKIITLNGRIDSEGANIPNAVCTITPEQILSYLKGLQLDRPSITPKI